MRASDDDSGAAGRLQPVARDGARTPGPEAVMFESRERLAADITSLLGAMRRASDGRYACLLSAEGIAFECQEEGEEVRFLRDRLRHRALEVLALPRQLEGEGPEDDVFHGLDEDAFLLTVVNGRVALVLACPDAELARAAIEKPLGALVDRLFRYEPRWRLDEKWRGLFVGRPKVDSVVIARPD